VISVPTSSGLRGLAHTLACGDLVALPIDGGSFLRGVRVPFAGCEIVFPAGAARLALLSGRPIVPVFSRRTAFMRQEVRIEAPLWPPARGPVLSCKAASRMTGAAAQRDDVPDETNSAAREGSAAFALTASLAGRLAQHLQRAADQWCIFRPLGTPARSS